MEVSGQFHAPATLHRGKSLRYPQGGYQSRSGRGVKFIIMQFAS
jgi:hypothetical protein